jgi:hypothetical protein
MWIKLLKNLYFEGGRFITRGTVCWLRRAGVVESQAVGSGEKAQFVFKQTHSVMTLELRDQEFILVLPDCAEGDLYEQTEGPK